jgi:GNAT superfamily N-acetyltransferase
VSWAKEFTELDKCLHDRNLFDSGEEELNDFIKTKAAKHMAAGISRTMVLPAAIPLPDGKYLICSYYAIAPGLIERNTLPGAVAKKLPLYPIPVFLIAQLAVHSELKGRGLGKITLVKALEHLWDINAHMKAYAVVVDCLNQAAQDFYLKFGFEILCNHNGRTRMFMPMKIVAQLFEKPDWYQSSAGAISSSLGGGFAPCSSPWVKGRPGGVTLAGTAICFRTPDEL